MQGVGFRPHVYRLAMEQGLAGWVANDSNGATIEIEGVGSAVEQFEDELVRGLPPLASISELSRQELTPTGDAGFRIAVSQADATRRPEVTPDAATCADCLRELFDSDDRRYRYPFINCTNCGPRYSIIRTVPYDRPATTMAVFALCPDCRAEYEDPGNRRFHAQPNACPVCGPALRLVRVAGERTEEIAGDAICEAARLIAGGAILAIKGIGGYHLACRADDAEVVWRLRVKKLRDGKPLALMVRDVAAVRELCALEASDEAALTSVAAPIVLGRKREDAGVVAEIAPGCGDLGVMLPYTPVHHLLFAEGLGPLVMTSANLAGQPLTYRDDDAFAQLGDVADAFLTHDREIFRPVDDSVVLSFAGEAVPIRRARGYAPRPLQLAAFDEIRAAGDGARVARVLAVGAELKSAVCLLDGNEAIVSEHLGDLGHPDTYRHFARAIERLEALSRFEPELVACDMHPRYLSTMYARQRKLPWVEVQHHHAHVASVMAEWGRRGPVLGLSCDGTGYGPDGTIWGGELLLCEKGEFARVGHLACFPLVGGDLAAVETWRPAAALVRGAFGDAWREVVVELSDLGGGGVTCGEVELFSRQAARGLNAVMTSSLGRVFDGVAFLLGLCARNRHEAEAAMALEAAARRVARIPPPYPYAIEERPEGLVMSLSPGLRELVGARRAGEAVEALAARFHATVVGMLVEAAGVACERHGVDQVVITGGCFANRILAEGVAGGLMGKSLRVCYPRRFPAGDGGVALGQAYVAAWRSAEGRSG